MILGRSQLHVPIIIVLTILVYAHTLHYPFYLDDQQNIVTNTQIQISECSFQECLGWLSASPYTQTFSRPISYLTLSVNWYFGQSTPFGYHIVNILIHILTAIFLYSTIRLLLSSEYFSRTMRSPGTSLSLVAFIATLLWALHPIQIQAVTYIVQRMSSLAALFSILALYFFIKNYSHVTTGQRLKALAISSLFYGLAILSKENAVILPFSLLLVHLIFYSRDTRPFSRYLKLFLQALSGIIVIGALFYVVTTGIFEQLFINTPYPGRPYTLLDRLLTQPRILVFHISQLLYPIATRFSIDHSFILSQSLFSPWTTFPALCVILGSAVFAMVKSRAFPLVSFAILFFLINHLVESTIIPLELVFEHRNYLPSLFFFLPIAYGIVALIIHFQKKSRIISQLISICTVILILTLGWSTYYRNLAWSSEEQLWLNAAKNAPLNARPYAYLGELYGFKKPFSKENYEKSIYYYSQAYGKFGPVSSFDMATLQNIGKIYSMYGDDEKARQFYQKAIEADTPYIIAYLELAKIYVRLREFEKATSLLMGKLSEFNPQYTAHAYNIMGLCALRLKQHELAVELFGKAITSSPDKSDFFHGMGAALARSGYLTQSRWFFEQALHHHPGNIRILLSALEQSVQAGDQKLTETYTDQLLEKYSIAQLKQTLENLETDFSSIPVNQHLLKPILLDAMARSAEQFDSP